MRKFNFLKMTLLAVVMMVGSVAWGQTQSLTITRASFPSGALAYGTDDLWTVTTTDNKTVTGYFDIFSNITQTTLQTRTNTPIGSYPYNTVAIPGSITKITLTGGATGTARSWEPYLSKTLISKKNYTTGISQGAKTATSNSASTEWIIDPSLEFSYFYLNMTGGGAAYLNSIVIEYETSSDPTITANPSSVTLSAEIDGLSVSQDINVTAINLNSAINTAITGTGASQFSVSPSELTKDGGVLTVSYSPSNEVATHTATLILSSEGAENVEIVLEGTTKEVSLIVGNETFESQTALTGNYADGYFSSETDGVTVNYANSRDQGLYPINDKGIMLRYANSYVDFVIPSGGVGTFNFKYRKAFTGGSERQIEVLVNETQYLQTPTFGTSSEEEVDVYDASAIINIAGAVTVRVKNVGSGTSNKQITIDDVSWTGYVSTDPLISVNPTSLDFGSVEIGSSVDAKTITVSSQNLIAEISAEITGDNASQFTVSPLTLTEAGELSVQYSPSTTAATHSAILTLSSTGATDVIVNLSGETKEPLDGDGTLNNPYTVNDVKALNNTLETTNNYWVKGYVIGVPSSGNGTDLTTVDIEAPFTTNTAIALSDVANENDLSKMIGVQLPSGDVRQTLNLQDNVDLLNVQVLVYGTLEGYFSGTPGVTKTSDYKILKSISKADGNWNTAETWLGGTIPTETLDVLVKNEITISASTTAKKVEVQPNGKLTINEGITLTAPITLQSDATGTATLIGAVSGTAEVQQYSAEKRTYYMGAPVKDLIDVSGIEKISTFEIATDSWLELANASSSNIPTDGRGFLAQTPIGTMSFKGTLNNGNVETDLARGTKNFNYLGNPYPSYLSSAAVLSTGATAGGAIETTVWQRTKDTNGFKFITYNSTDGGTSVNGDGSLIAPMQGFWVNATAAGKFTFTNAMRTHNVGTTGSFKAPRVAQSQRLLLEVSNGTSTDEAMLRFNSDAGTGIDNWDSRKMMNSAGALNVYTLHNGVSLAINSNSAITEGIEIPVGLSLAAGTYTISAKEFTNFAAGTKVNLLDKATGLVTDLSVADYEFTLTESLNSSARFAIVFPKSDVPTSVEGLNDAKSTIFVRDNRIVVSTNEAANGGMIYVFNSVGQQIAAQSVNGKVNEINIALQPGVYVVKLKNQTEKVIVK